MRNGAPSEQRKIEAAQRDPAQFSKLYEDNFYRVYAYIARRVGERQQAEELTAEVFHEALANLGKFEWRGAPFEAWLIRIAANTVADYWRDAERESGAIASGEPPQHDEVERRAMLFQLVDRLPEAQRRVIHLRFVEQRSIREIAADLGRSEGAVKQLQLRALEALRQAMEGAR
jgi:RNA polymerase sigma-70 factor (ECF subfamily)